MVIEKEMMKKMMTKMNMIRRMRRICCRFEERLAPGQQSTRAMLDFLEL